MLTFEQLERQPLYQEFDACFSGHFKKSINTLRFVLELKRYGLYEAVRVIRGCWDEFEALMAFMTSGFSEFIADTYTGAYDAHEVALRFYAFIGLVLEALEYEANVRKTLAVYTEDDEDAEEAEEAAFILDWIASVRRIIATKTENTIGSAGQKISH